MATTKNTVSLSLPKSRTVRGYTVERMPLGRFLAAMELLKEAPANMLKEVFPDSTPEQVLGRLAALTKDGLGTIFISLATTLPEYAVRLFSQLSGIDEDKLLTDPAVGLDGLIELAEAWIDVNGLENFIKAAGALPEDNTSSSISAKKSDARFTPKIVLRRAISGQKRLRQTAQTKPLKPLQFKGFTWYARQDLNL